MKKWIVCLLAVIMLLNLTACDGLLEDLQSQLGGFGSDSDDGKGSGGLGNILDGILGGGDEETPDIGDIGGILDGIFGGGSNEGSDGDGNNTTEGTIVRGTVNDDTYTSRSCGLSFTVTGNWRIMSEAELSANVNAGIDIMDPNDFQEALISQASVYDVMAMNSVTRSSLLIGYENLAYSGSVGISPSDYMSSAIRIMNQSGMSAELTGHKTVTLSGVRFDRFECSIRYSGASMMQYYYVRNMGNYMNIVVIGVNGQDNISQIESMFH